MKKLTSRAAQFGPELLAALERLLVFPQNQDSTDVKLHDAIRHAQTLVNEIRRPTQRKPGPESMRAKRSQ